MTPADWIAWTCALTRPQRVDDEEPPEGVALPPWWDHGTAAERQPSRALTLPEVLYGQHLEPVEGEACDYQGACSGACYRP